MQDKFQVFVNYSKTGFEEVWSQLIGCSLQNVNLDVEEEKNRVAVIIGITGVNKGRILMETGYSTALKIAEEMNQGPLDEKIDLYFNIVEFANMFCGRAITYINNNFKESQLRLAPPAIFGGIGLELETPSIKSDTTFFWCEYGKIKIDAGFEGM